MSAAHHAIRRLPLLAGLVLLWPVPGAQAYNDLTPGVPMGTARSGHTATLLPSGKVLIAGGMGSFSVGGPALGTAELYDPATRTWTPTGSLVNPVDTDAAVLLLNGKVLACNLYSKSAELYDPATGIWTSTGSLVNVHNEGTLTLLADGKVLVAGGLVSTGSSFSDLYDPARGTWKSISDNYQFLFQSATLLQDGSVLYAGGTSFTKLSNYGFLYNPYTESWANSGTSFLNLPRAAHTTALLNNGKVLIAGGYYDWFDEGKGTRSAELYDPATFSWATTGPMHEGRVYPVSLVLPGGQVLVLGGSQGVNVLTSTEIYDPASGRWSTTGSMHTRRAGFTATLLPNGDVLVAGGNTPYLESLASTEIFHSSLGTLHYQGLVQPDSRIAVRSGTLGFLTCTLQTNRSFTGRLTLDGRTLAFTGAFDEGGVARFGPQRVTRMAVGGPLPGKPEVFIALRIDLGALAQPYRNNHLTGTITQQYRSTTVAVSTVDAGLVVPSGPALAGTMIFPAANNSPADFPQGSGFGTINITSGGNVTLAGWLADGTPFTSSSATVRRAGDTTASFPLFASLYNGQGVVSAQVFRDEQNPDSDLSAGDGYALWVRPAMDTQHFPKGWPDGVGLTVAGARYQVLPGVSVLRTTTGQPPGDANENGNALLDIEQGLLGAPFTKSFNLGLRDEVEKLPIFDQSYSLAVTRRTALFAGTFSHEDGTQPAFQGIIFQKGANAGGHGFFLTTTPPVKDYTGQSGVVTLTAP